MDDQQTEEKYKTSKRYQQVMAKERRKRKNAKIAKMNQGSGVLDTEVGRLMRPVVNYREQLLLKGIIPKDYSKLNRRKIRAIQKKNRFKKQMQLQKIQEMKQRRRTRLQCFNSYKQDTTLVNSLLPPISGSMTQNAARASSERNFETNRVNNELKEPEDFSEKKDAREKRKRKKHRRRKRSQNNKKLPGLVGLERSPSRLKRLNDEKKIYRRDRIERRKMSNMEEMQRIPGAMSSDRILTTNERMATLEVLETSRKKIENKLRGMPLALNGAGARKRKEEYIQKLNEIERAIEIFERDIVVMKRNGK